MANAPPRQMHRRTTQIPAFIRLNALNFPVFTTSGRARAHISDALFQAMGKSRTPASLIAASKQILIPEIFEFLNGQFDSRRITFSELSTRYLKVASLADQVPQMLINTNRKLLRTAAEAAADTVARIEGEKKVGYDWGRIGHCKWCHRFAAPRVGKAVPYCYAHRPDAEGKEYHRARKMHPRFLKALAAIRLRIREIEEGRAATLKAYKDLKASDERSRRGPRFRRWLKAAYPSLSTAFPEAQTLGQLIRSVDAPSKEELLTHDPKGVIAKMYREIVRDPAQSASLLNRAEAWLVAVELKAEARGGKRAGAGRKPKDFKAVADTNRREKKVRSSE